MTIAPGDPWSLEDVQRMLELRARGMSIQQIADAMNISYLRVKVRLLKMRKKPLQAEESAALAAKQEKRKAKIKALVDEGKTLAQISRALGLSRTTVQSVLERAGIKAAIAPPPEAKPWERMGISRERYQEPLDKPLPPFHPIAREVLARAAALQIGAAA